MRNSAAPRHTSSPKTAEPENWETSLTIASSIDESVCYNLMTFPELAPQRCRPLNDNVAAHVAGSAVNPAKMLQACPRADQATLRKTSRIAEPSAESLKGLKSTVAFTR